MNIEDKNAFINYLERDIENLEIGIREMVLTKINDTNTFSIEFDFFKKKINELCFNIISPDKDCLDSEVLRERFELFKKIFIKSSGLENITAISFKNSVHTQIPEKLDLIYLLYYEIFKQRIYSSNEVKNVFQRIFEEWKTTFEEKKFPVVIKVIFPRIHTDDDIVINEEFHIKKPHEHKHIKNFDEIDTFEIENIIIHETILSFNCYEHFSGAFENFFLSNWEKFDKEWWQIVIKKIHEISSSFYLMGIEFRQEDEKIITSLPWWLNLEERENAKNLQRSINPYAHIISMEKYNEFREIYRIVKDSRIFIDEKYEFIRSRFSQIFNRKSYQYQDIIVDSFILFEHLFGENGNEKIIFRLSFNGAFFLSDNLPDFLKKFIFFKKAYSIRSKIVHGEEWSHILKKYIYGDKKLRSLLRLIKKLKKYINDCLKKLINLKSENPMILQDINNYSDPAKKIRKSSCFNELGDYYGNIKEFSEALKMYKEALKIAKDLDDQERIKKCEKEIQAIYQKSEDVLIYLDELEKFKEELKISIKYNPKKSEVANSVKKKIDIFRNFSLSADNNDEIILKINGQDIMKILGIPQSKKIGEIKLLIKEKILAGELINEKEELIEFVKNLDI